MPHCDLPARGRPGAKTSQKHPDPLHSSIDTGYLFAQGLTVK
jgi:hypothetical protein